MARKMIPSNRVFRRDGTDGEYSLLHYGDVTIRALPALWQEVVHENLEIGDWVEVLSRGMQNEPRTGVVREMLWDESTRAIGYQIEEAGRTIEELYARDDLQRVEPV